MKNILNTFEGIKDESRKLKSKKMSTYIKDSYYNLLEMNKNGREVHEQQEDEIGGYFRNTRGDSKVKGK